MQRLAKPLLVMLFMVALGLILAYMVHNHPLAVLTPEGPVAAKERDLILAVTGLMLLVVVPVFALTFFIAWKYRADNPKARYEPEWDRHAGLEFLWWAFPCAVIAAISAMAWQSSHELDPFRPLDSAVRPLTVQVVALPWKWLFIYPEQHIATVNQVVFPEGTPVNFTITSDAPMNSFWIPQLGGQVYAMPGMSTQLHLMADSTGTYQGSSANLSGTGFAGMRFAARSVSAADFASWASATEAASSPLTRPAYDRLAEPSQDAAPTAFSSPSETLYSEVVMKYMLPELNGGTPHTHIQPTQ